MLGDHVLEWNGAGRELVRRLSWMVRTVGGGKDRGLVSSHRGMLQMRRWKGNTVEGMVRVGEMGHVSCERAYTKFVGGELLLSQRVLELLLLLLALLLYCDRRGCWSQWNNGRDSRC